MSQHTIVLPKVCYICGKAADHEEYVSIVSSYKTTSLNVPICNNCASLKKRAGRGLAVTWSLLTFTFLLSIGFAGELGRQARLADATSLTKAFSLVVQVIFFLVLAIIVGSASGFVRDGLRAFALRLTGSFKTWREAWTWVRYSRIGNDPVSGFPIFRNPEYSRLVSVANR